MIRNREHQLSTKVDDVEFEIKIIESVHWPFEHLTAFTIPPKIKNCIDSFEHFYKEKHRYKNLIWAYHLGFIEVQTTFTSEKFLLATNIFQATILCLFNENTELTVKEIREKSSIPYNFIKTALNQLCYPQLCVLYT